jgi:hypothetical protein
MEIICQLYFYITALLKYLLAPASDQADIIYQLFYIFAGSRLLNAVLLTCLNGYISCNTFI